MSSKEKKIGLVGTGNVAYHFSRAFLKNEIFISAIYGRDKNKVSELTNQTHILPTNSIKEISAVVDILILAVSDDAIENVLTQIENKKIIILHTSGSKEIEIFSKYGFENHGVFYPLQSLSKKDTIDYKKIPICLEASTPEIMILLEKIAKKISNNVKIISSEQRKILHLAAVFANNFTNHMFTISNSILEKHKLSFDILKPLIEHTVKKIDTHTPQSQQTGPAIRGDINTQQQHLKLLIDPQHQEIYKQISQHIANQSTPDI